MKNIKMLLAAGLGMLMLSEVALACSVDPNAQMRADLYRVMNTKIVQNQIKRWGGKLDSITFDASTYWIAGNHCAMQIQAVYKQMPTPHGSVASCPVFVDVKVLLAVCQ